MKYLILLMFVFTMTFSQTKSDVLSRSDYDKIKSDLLNKKQSLISERNNLKEQIGELTKEQIQINDPNYRREICRDYFIKKYGRKIGNRILNGQVWKGMTEQMLRDSYGKPDKITRNKEKWGTFAQYYYGKQIFFFKNGKLFDWQK